MPPTLKSNVNRMSNKMPGNTNKLLNLLKEEGPELTHEFDKASVKGRGTPQEVADFRENYFRNFMARYFPYPHRIAKGKVIDSFDKESDSIDCIIINPVHPFTIDINGKFDVILADGVDAAIELKPNIMDKNELIRGLRQIISIKKLLRAKAIGSFIWKNRPEYIIDHSRRISAFIFCDKAKQDPIQTGKDVYDFYRKNNIPLEEQVDYIIINSVGIISNFKFPELNWAGNDTGLFLEMWNELTIAAFIIHLNNCHPAVMRISDPIINRYFKRLKPYKMVKLISYQS